MLTEVMHPYDGGSIEEQREEVRRDHERMPRAHRQPHHQQLSQDQRSERDAHDVDELVLE